MNNKQNPEQNQKNKPQRELTVQRASGESEAQGSNSSFIMWAEWHLAELLNLSGPQFLF